MKTDKDKFVLNVVELITEISVKSHASSNTNMLTKDSYLLDFVGVTGSELASIAMFIADGLSEKIYLARYRNVRNVALLKIAKQLVLFLVQENKESQYFKNNLTNFKDEILGEIMNNIYVKNKENRV